MTPRWQRAARFVRPAAVGLPATGQEITAVIQAGEVDPGTRYPVWLGWLQTQPGTPAIWAAMPVDQDRLVPGIDQAATKGRSPEQVLDCLVASGGRASRADTLTALAAAGPIPDGALESAGPALAALGRCATTLP
jgi:hypothetical protein